jgi:hypothetical protein
MTDRQPSPASPDLAAKRRLSGTVTATGPGSSHGLTRGGGSSPDEPMRQMIRERRPDLTEEQIDAMLAPLNEAGEALARATAERAPSPEAAVVEAARSLLDALNRQGHGLAQLSHLARERYGDLSLTLARYDREQP